MAKHPDATVIDRDLAAHPLPHLTAEVVGAFFTPADKRSPEQAKAIEPSDKAVDELLAADAIVIGAPMWNFGIPSSLKAWIDHVVRAGRTFQYGANGPAGLIPGGKKAIVVSSRGGVYSAGPYAMMDHQESYLKAILGFMGITDISFATAEGLSMGGGVRQAGHHHRRGQG